MRLRNYFALLVAALATLLLSNFAHSYWVRAFIEGRNFDSTRGWGSLSWLSLTWGYDILAALFGALLLAPLLARGSRIWWYVGFGAVIATLRLLSSHSFVSAHSSTAADVEFAVWRYGSYLMSVMGALLGGCIALTVQRMTPPNQRLERP